LSKKPQSHRPGRGDHECPAPGIAPRLGAPASAQFDADRFAQAWDGGEPIRPDDSVSGTIDRFSPKDVPPAIWNRIEPLVKEAVATSTPRTVSRANDLLTVTAQLAVWAHRIGQPLDPEILFHPDTVDRFVTEGCAHLSEGSRLNYRTQLWKVGAAVLGPALYPPRPLPMRRSEVTAPYLEAQITEVVSWSQGLPTEAMRRNVQALLAIGLGAGLSAREVKRLVGTEVREEEGLVLVEVVGDNARTVPVRGQWAQGVLAFARESGPRPYFRPERLRITRGDILAFIDRCTEPDQDAMFSVQRLRVTWVVSHLAAGVPVGVLARGAGVGPGHLTKYLRFVPEPDELATRRLLSGVF
jgi:hypothetical protein